MPRCKIGRLSDAAACAAHCNARLINALLFGQKRERCVHVAGPFLSGCSPLVGISGLRAAALAARAAAARRRVQAAGRSAGTALTVAFRPGIIITDVVKRFTTEHPEVAVNAIRVEWDEQHAAIADGRADIAWIRTPISGNDLVLTPLFNDPEVIALPVAHPLAESDAVSLADLAGQTMLRYDAAPEHEAGRPSPGRGIRTMEEKLEAVALGHGLALVPATAAAYYQRPDITYRPVTGAQPYQVALATTTEAARRPEVRAFVKIALADTDQTPPM